MDTRKTGRQIRKYNRSGEKFACDVKHMVRGPELHHSEVDMPWADYAMEDELTEADIEQSTPIRVETIGRTRAAKARKSTFVAYSTENFAMTGITILALAATRDEADARGRSKLPSPIRDLRDDTWHKNFAVCSESELRRRIGARAYEYALDRFLSEDR